MRLSRPGAVLLLVGTGGCSLLLNWNPPVIGPAMDGGYTADGGSGVDGGTGSDSGSCAPGASFVADPLNCGACGHGCLGGGCDGGQCLPMQLVASANAWHLSVDPTQVFWTVNQVDGGIWRAALDGTGAVERAPGQVSPAGIVVAFGNVYWTTPPATGFLWQDDVNGLNAPAQFTVGASKNIAVDPAFLYWAGPFGAQTILFRESPDSGQPFNVACQIGTLNQVVVDDANAYWTETKGTLSSVPKNTLCGPITLLADSGTSGAVAVWGGEAYFGVTSSTDGGVWRVPVGGGTPPAPFVAGGTLVRMVADPQGLYWTEDPPGNIVWFPWDGGAPRVLGQRNHPRDIVTDNAALYWTETSDAGGIYKLAK